ncbi:MAG: hypothetical protein AAFO28_08725, partial [Pseudomonadota bacterium]
MSSAAPADLPSERTGKPDRIALVAVGVGLAVSVGAVFAVTSNSVLTAVFGLALLVLLGAVIAFERTRVAPDEVLMMASPDWSVTLAAIEGEAESSAVAVAITDRANRLVCANSAYVDAFDVASA